MEKTGNMEFKTTFDKDYPQLMFDEPEKSGGADKGPSATRILTAAVANCLAASLTFCLTRSRVPMENFGLIVEATGTTARNDEQRWRVKQIKVDLQPSFKGGLPEEFIKKFERCVKIYQDYCVVSASVKQGIDIKASVSLQ
jgi:uncharacterized OsmC-like protein